MKNYRTIELPDCCAICISYRDPGPMMIFSYCVDDFEYVMRDGLCDSFKRCGSQNAKSDPQRPDIDKCKCNLRTRLVGDGCQYCNPEYHAEMLQEDDGEE